MNILLVGSGGREHALAWKIAQSPRLKRLVCAPGNPGMAGLSEIRDIKATDAKALVALAEEIEADLVVIGPEVAVEAGLADRLSVAGMTRAEVLGGHHYVGHEAEVADLILKTLAALPPARP